MNGEIEGSTRGPRGPKNCRLGILGHPKTEDDFQILFYTNITYYTQNVNDFYDTLILCQGIFQICQGTLTLKITFIGS